MRTTERHDGRRPARVIVATAAALFTVAALTAGCSSGSGPGVASAGSSARPAAAGKQQPSTLAYAKCMIGHGIKNFPEPNASGQLQLAQGQQLPDMNSPQFQTAMKACAALRLGGTVSPAQQAAQQAALVKYAKCMRAHGVPNFPDPASNGTFDVGAINVQSSAVQTADKACASPGVGLFQGRTSA